MKAQGAGKEKEEQTGEGKGGREEKECTKPTREHAPSPNIRAKGERGRHKGRKPRVRP